ncbi:hypothetical protein M3Y95_00573700 [Aphelenchoides besseyi]|nr:hypothetical protein M3Y95_00573700 [Aphelenchoides besseyi]
MEETSISTGPANLIKAKEYRDSAKRAMSVDNYREAVRLFHQCILLARGISQTSSVSIHQQATISVAFQPPSENADMNEQTKVVADQCENRIAAEELIKKEAHGLMIECYLSLADCVLNGGPRSHDDYNRTLVYCDNVFAYDPNDEQKQYATLKKGTSYLKLGDYKNALAQLQQLPEDDTVQQLIQECVRKQLDEKRKRDQMIQANFAKQQQNQNGHADGMNGHAQNGFVR